MSTRNPLAPLRPCTYLGMLEGLANDLVNTAVTLRECGLGLAPVVKRAPAAGIVPLSRRGMRRLVDAYGDGRLLDKHRRLFITRNTDGTYTAADNNAGECFVESFSTAEEALRWLRGDDRKSQGKR